MSRHKPIYRSAQDHWPESVPQHSHKGLWFTRFYNGFDNDWKIAEAARSGWLEKLTGPCGGFDALHQAALRNLELGATLHGTSRTFVTQWHFVTGMGLPHPVENGLTWHPTLGAPYICGAAVKGLLCAWIEEYADLDDEERQARKDLWFGKPERAGVLIFFDACPARPPEIGTDVMTPHMGNWYEKGGKTQTSADAKDVDPADWHSPIPVTFLVVRKATFLFTIAPRRAEHAGEAMRAMDALAQALEEMGAGAKTAVGYGDMTADSRTLDVLQKEIDDERKKRAKEREWARMDPIAVLIAKEIEKAKRNNMGPEVALIKRLECGDWQGEQAVRAAEKARDLMQAKKKWRPESQRRRPERDRDHQRTLFLLKILDGA